MEDDQQHQNQRKQKRKIDKFDKITKSDQQQDKIMIQEDTENSNSEISSNLGKPDESQQQGSLVKNKNFQTMYQQDLNDKSNQDLDENYQDIKGDQDGEEDLDKDEDFQVEGPDNVSSDNFQQDDELNNESNQQLSESALKKKRKAGRPQKKDFLSAEKQKNMKELEIEIELASSFSSENYLLLYCALLIYGQGPKGNKYIVKAYSQGEKDLDVGSKIKSMGSQVSVECKRMWLLYWKISRILNRDTNIVFKELWTGFQGIVMNQNPNEKFDSQILSSISKLRQLFGQNKQYVDIVQNQRYSSITEYCFDPQLDQESENEEKKGSNNEAEDDEEEQEEENEELQQKGQEQQQQKQSNKSNADDSESNQGSKKQQKGSSSGKISKGVEQKKSLVKKEEANIEQQKEKNCVKGKNVSFNSKKDRENNRHFDYQSFEKHLLHLHKFQKSDFLAILFSCAVSEYFNILSPYFDSFCNIL